MLLTVAFVPPMPVLDELNAVIDAAGWRPGDLERIAAPDMQISVVAFGNVARSQTVELASVLTRIAAGWPAAPVLRFSGGAALEWPGDQTVWAKLVGDVEALEAVAQSISPAMLRLGFAVDRRRFRPWLPVGTVTATTELRFLERLLVALNAHEGQAWEASHLSMLRTAFDASRPRAKSFEVLREFTLPAP
jgi:RNA 2',3'-cyclic 3'-phosphodiesterase